jgi:hypothetical protein
MFNEKLGTCPSCNQQMHLGFSTRNIGLSLITLENMRKTVFMDWDLNQSGLKNILPAIASYNLSYHCPKCQIYIVDYSRAVSTSEAKELAATTID